MYCGAVRNICAIWHSCIVADGAVAADASKVPHRCAGANNTVGMDQSAIPYRCITVDLCSGIQQNTISDRCTVLDTSVLQHHTTTSQLGVGADIGTGSNNVRKRIAKCFCLFIHLCPELVVANAHHQQAVFFPQLRKISKTTNHRSAADLSPHRLSIIHKGTVVLEHRLLRHQPAATFL